MAWPWKQKLGAAGNADIIKAVERVQEARAGRPEHKICLLITKALQETLRNMFGECWEAKGADPIWHSIFVRVACEYLYCASCLTFSALSAVDAATAMERTRQITEWSKKAAELLLLKPDSVPGEANTAFRQMWNAHGAERQKAGQPAGYARPIDAVGAYAQRTRPLISAARTLKGLSDACLNSDADMEFLLESLIFTVPELFRPAPSVVVGAVGVNQSYGLGFIEHYSALDTRRAEREARTRVERAEYCELSRKIEELVHSQRGSAD